MQHITLGDVRKFIKRIYKEFKSHISAYAIIVTAILLITLTSKFGGWQGLTAIGTLGMGLAVFILEVLLPYIRKPRLMLTFDRKDKRYCREARILELKPKKQGQNQEKGESTHEITSFEPSLGEPYEIIPPSGLLGPNLLDVIPGTGVAGLTYTAVVYSDANRNAKSRKGISISSKKGYFIRIKVQNTGNSLAKKCQGVIADVSLVKKDSDEIKYFVPLVLHWANRSPRLFC
ncbi:unnamed protein product, partial [marine sediment metagenome]